MKKPDRNYGSGSPAILTELKGAQASIRPVTFRPNFTIGLAFA